MRLLPALAYLLWPGWAAAQPPAERLTLEEAVSLAVRNNPAVLAAEQDTVVSRQRVREAMYLSLPQLSLSGVVSRAEIEYPAVLGAEFGDRYLGPAGARTFYTMRAQALQPLYTGGRNRNTLRLAKTAHNQAKANYEAVRSEAAAAAKKAFYALLYQARQREAGEAWLKRAEAAAAAPGKTAYEEIEAAAIMAALASGAKEAAQEEEAARAELLRALNREPDRSVEADGEFAVLPGEGDLSGSLITAMQSRPELKSEVYKAQMDDIAVNMAMIRRNPTVYLGAAYDVNSFDSSPLSGDPSRTRNWQASLAINFPLSYDIWTQVLQRRAQQRQGELKRAELQDKVRFEITGARRDLAFWRGEADRLSALAASMRASYEAAAGNSRPSMGALRAAAAVCSVERKYLEAVYRHLLARIRLERARGRDLPVK